MEDNDFVSKFEFVYDDPYTGNYVYKYVPTNTWPEAMDGFLAFLRGCSFVLSREEVALYLHQQVHEHEEAIYGESRCRGCDDSTRS